MAQWQFTLDFSDFWKKEDIPVFKISKKVVSRINELLPVIRKRNTEIYKDMADELENDILPMFEALIEEKSEDVEEFDNALEALYDWADTPLDNNWGGKKMCWVETF